MFNFEAELESLSARRRFYLLHNIKQLADYHRPRTVLGIPLNNRPRVDPRPPRLPDTVPLDNALTEDHPWSNRTDCASR